MAIFEMTSDDFRQVTPTTFGIAKIREREDLQRLLRSQIHVIAEDVLIIAEEFAEWDGSKRRIDLLGIDKNANLVVIELKRTEDGGHMDLQAIRYAAMISAMTFERAAEVYAAFLRSEDISEARQRLMAHLGWIDFGEGNFAADIRIILVSAEFSKEITTSVIWLNRRGLDITCVRMTPYLLDNRLLVDVQQVIPLVEAQDYLVRIKEKEVRELSVRRERSAEGGQNRTFWTELQQRMVGRTEMHQNVGPPDGSAMGCFVAKNVQAYYHLRADGSMAVRLVFIASANQSSATLFDAVALDRNDIEQRFGHKLEWDRGDGQTRTKVLYNWTGPSVFDGETREAAQDQMIETMIRFVAAFRPTFAKLGI